MSKKVKILLYDIESSPNLGYTWGKYEQTVLKFVKQRELLSVAWKWVGDEVIHADSRQGEKTDKRLAGVIRDLFQEADIIIAHNGDKFDKKVVKTRMIAHGMNPPKVLVSVDTCKVAKNYFSFNGNSLNDLADFFGFGGKLPTTGFGLWLDCMKNRKKAWQTMIKYNKHDVYLLDRVYTKMRPWIENHPHVGRLLAPNDNTPGVCPACGSDNCSKYGIRPTAIAIQQRWVCKDCSHSFKSRYVKG